MTHHLRFPDASTGLAALDAAGLLSHDGTPLTASHTWALDVIGVITTGGTWDPETGDQLTPPTVLDGWHVNLQGALPDGWESYVVHPQNPSRTWI